jgi:hypothetical protein
LSVRLRVCAERQDFAPDSPRGNVICRMVDASEIAFVAVFLASDKARPLREVQTEASIRRARPRVFAGDRLSRRAHLWRKERARLS